MKKVSVIIPAYNEEESIEPLFGAIKNYLSQEDKEGYFFEIIFVDDGSSDQTLLKMQKTKDAHVRSNIIVKIVSFTQNFGKTEAMNAGIDESTGDYLIFMDADLQDNPKYIHDFIHEIEVNNLDFVIGNRKNRYKNNLIKNVSSRVVNFLMKILTRVDVQDMNCGFKIMRRSVAQSIILKSDYHRFVPLICGANGFLVGEISIVQEQRKYSTSKYGSTGLLRLLKSVTDGIGIFIVLRFRKEPFNLFGKSGICMFVIGFSILLYLSIGWFMGNYILSRPLFFLGILLVITGVNLTSMGFLGELMSYDKRTRKYQLRKEHEESHL